MTGVDFEIKQGLWSCMLKGADKAVLRPHVMCQCKPEVRSRHAAHLAALDEGKV